mmetsp:Transcript_8907/g.10165  ORF Transcript_8907/g.10165 Transcript_8907/m.10165 type:complete len:304 (+) Transcript_8907:155-1066(+)
MLFPYCFGDPDDYGHDAGQAWDCARGSTLGVVNFIAFLYGCFAVYRIAAVYFRTRWYLVNFIMLTLATLQCGLTAWKYNMLREQRLSYTASYLRGLQSILTCSTYGKAACASLNKDSLYFKVLVPLLSGFVLYFSIIFVIALTIEDIPCQHPNWLLMSVSQMCINLIFAIAGFIVMKMLASGAANISRDYTEFLDGEQYEVKQQRRALTLLLVFNASGSFVQVCLDVWLRNVYDQTKDCHYLDSSGDELLRLLMKIFSYDVPVLVTIYVFYWMPRRQFDPELEVVLSDDEALQEIESELLTTW